MRQFKKFAFDVSWVLASSAVNLALGFVLRIILARWLGSYDLGLYTMVLTVQQFATLFAAQGIMAALTKFVAEYHEDEEQLSQMICSAFTITLVFAVAATLLLFFLANFIAGLFNMPQLAHLLRIVSISIPFIVINQTSLGLENGLRRMKHYSAQIIMRSALMTVFIVTLVWLGYGVEGTVWGMVLSVVGTCIWGLYLARKFYHIAYHNFLKNIKKLISFGVQVFSTQTVNLLMSYTDTLMIGYLLTATDVGYYSVAVSMAMLFSIVPQAVQRNTYPMTAMYWHKNDIPSLQNMLDKSMKYTACILFPLGLVFAFFAEEITTTVFGVDYISSVTPFLILLVARVLIGSTIEPIGASYSARGRPDISLKIDALSLVFNVVLNWFFIKWLGISGAATATTVSILVGTLVFIRLLPMLHVKLDYKWYALLAGLTGAAIGIFWIGSRIINQYVVGGVILLLYVLIIFRFFLNKEDRGLFKSLAASMVRKIKK
jgi:stage V sporulation protein B